MEFKVTPGELENLANGLSGLLGELAQAGDACSISAGAAENGQLQGAIEGFVARWAQEIETLQASLTSLTERLSGAGSGYEQAEHGIVGEFGI
jgi:hypothetical protein